jgi:hypothetical protein
MLAADENGSAIGSDGRYVTSVKRGQNPYTFIMILTISHVRQSDAGEYICQYGDRSDSISLNSNLFQILIFIFLLYNSLV